MLPPPLKRRRITPPILESIPQPTTNNLTSNSSDYNYIESPIRTKDMPIMISSSPSHDKSPSPDISPTSPIARKKNILPKFNLNNSKQEISVTQNIEDSYIKIRNQFMFATQSEDEINHSASNITLLFSPQKQRRYTYTFGGMATTVRDWVLETASTSTESTSQMYVKQCKHYRDMIIACGTDENGEYSQWLLMGSPQDKLKNLDNNSIVLLMEPTWTIELQGETWKVGIKWTIIE
jgi:hypothetical protein